MNRLTASNPAPGKLEPPPGLFTRITAAPTSWKQRPSRVRKNVTRGTLALLIALVVGGGVSWATSGEGIVARFERLWGIDVDSGLSSDSSGYGLGEFSILEPMSDDRIEQLPSEVNQSLVGARALPVRGPNGDLKLHLNPGHISAWGHTSTIGGNGMPSQPVDVVSMNGKICAVWSQAFLAYCGTLKEARKEGLSISSNDEPSGIQWTSGAVTDEVKTLRLKGYAGVEVPLKDNFFQLNFAPKKQTVLLGLDENGSVVTRILIPGRPSGSDLAYIRAIKRWQRNPVGPPPNPPGSH